MKKARNTCKTRSHEWLMYNTPTSAAAVVLDLDTREASATQRSLTLWIPCNPGRYIYTHFDDFFLPSASQVQILPAGPFFPHFRPIFLSSLFIYFRI